MTQLEENSEEINKSQETFKKAECRFDALAELKVLEKLYTDRVMILSNSGEDFYGIRAACAISSQASIGMVIEVLEKI